MTVGQILAKLGVDNKEYEKGLKKAEAQADKAGLKIGKWLLYLPQAGYKIRC